jgi:hypothetical protein
MKKYILVIVIIINTILTICLGIKNSQYKVLSEDDVKYIAKIEELRKEQNDIENKISTSKSNLATIEKQIEENKKIAEGSAKYIMKINIAQSHFTLDINEHLKDSMNDVDLYIEVSEEYYNKYNVGDTIADDFRVGSLIFKGSFGSWNIKVTEKQIV